MASVNKVILIGHLGRDPEVKFLDKGAVANFSIATTESWTKDGTKQERTEWHRIVAWGKLAELCGEYLARGRQVYVEGKIQSRKYKGKDGQERQAFEIIAHSVTFLGSGKGDGSRGETGGDYSAPPPADDGSDTPF